MGKHYRNDYVPSLRDRACGKKYRHATRKDAITHMESLQKRDGVNYGGKGLNVYRCWYCQHWHVGHTRRIERKQE